MVALLTGACFLALTASGQTPFIPPDAFGEPASSSLTFYENQGQLLDESGQQVPTVKFLSRASVPALFMSDSRISFVYAAIDTIASTPDSLHRIDLRPYGDAPELSEPAAYEAAPDHLNFLLPHVTAMGVPGHKRIIYENMFPEIDMHIYSNAAGVKAYFVVHPGADPALIQLQFSGIDSLKVASNVLDLYLSNEVLTLPVIATYQLDGNGDPEWTTTPTTYHDEGNNVVSFDVGSYNSTEPLMIQIGAPMPTMQATDGLCWSTYHGNSNNDNAQVIKTDADGNIFFAGTTRQINFPNTPGTIIQTNFGGNEDVFLIKFDHTGVPEWGTLYGGSSNEFPRDIAFSSNKDVYVTGRSFSSNLPLLPTGNSSQNGTQSAFVLSVNNIGNTWRWSRYIGGNGHTEGNGIAIDSQDNIYIAGQTTSTSSFPIVSGGTKAYNQTSSGGDRDGFVVLFDDGHSQLWGTYFGGGDWDNFQDIATGADDRIFLFGSTKSATPASSNSSNPPCGVPTTGYFPDCDPGGNAYTQAFNSTPPFPEDAIVVEFEPDGQLAWSTYLGGDGIEAGGRLGNIVVDPQNSDLVYVLGYTSTSNGFPIVNPGGGAYVQTATTISNMAFLLKFDSREVVWGTVFGCAGGTGTTDPEGLAIDHSGNIFITGNTSCSVPPSPANYCLPSSSAGVFPICPSSSLFLQEDGAGNPQFNGGTYDGFIAAFNSSSQLIWSSWFGGASPGDYPRDIAYDDQYDKIFLTGNTQSTTLFPIHDPQTPGTYMQFTNAGNYDAFLACFDVGSLTTSLESALNIPDHIRLYPNPNQGTFSLEHGFPGNPLITVDVFNPLGQVVHQTQMKSHQTSINLSGFASGIYYVRLLHQGEIYTLKMIRE